MSERYTADTLLSLIENDLLNEDDIKRILRNEQLRQFIIKLRDDDAFSAPVTVIQELIDNTEDLTA